MGQTIEKLLKVYPSKKIYQAATPSCGHAAAA